MPVEEALTQRSVALIAAHPDDETVSAGGLMAHMRLVALIHVTDGAPRNGADARAAGFQTREDYAQARRQELLNALADALLDVGAGHARPGGAAVASPPVPLHSLGLLDQEASFAMPSLARRILELLRDLRPAAVLTHPYEGGHPDHDATAFAVHAACALMPAPPDLYEFTSYHQASNEDQPQIETGRFLPHQDQGEVIALTAADRERKSRMIACFATQLHMLRHFPVDVERFRAAPVYDFSQSPHPGKLFYDYFDWGITGERWRSLAGDAVRALGTPVTL